MKFSPIFVSENECKLWAACYPEHQVDGEDRDIFNITMEQWLNAHYLKTFLLNNEDELNDPYWEKVDMIDIINQIRLERSDFMNELYSIETRQSGYKHISLNSIFKRLHTNIYSLSFKGDCYRKAKPFFSRAILRMYAIELDDATFVITGGTIKLTKKMEGFRFKREFGRLDRVKDFLNRNGIIDRQGLIEQ